mmetsp:Transcript_35712/g.111710  ORF Transcript_35712/g.111710 Transcript_35712/m.111710 type:complete len:530 (-) Transcript_35712:4427-6016(-)
MPTQCLASKEKCWQDLESLFQSHGDTQVKWKLLAEAGETQGTVPAAREWLLRYSADSMDELPLLVCAIAIFSEQGDECAVERVCRELLMDQSNPSLIEAVIWSLEKLYRYGQQSDPSALRALLQICCDRALDIRQVSKESLVSAISLLLVAVNSTEGQKLSQVAHDARRLTAQENEDEGTLTYSSATTHEIELLCRFIQDRWSTRSEIDASLAGRTAADWEVAQSLSEQLWSRFYQRSRKVLEEDDEGEETSCSRMTSRRSLWHLVKAKADGVDFVSGLVSAENFDQRDEEYESIKLFSGLENGLLNWMNPEEGSENSCKHSCEEEADAQLMTSQCQLLVRLPPELFDDKLHEFTDVRLIVHGDPREGLIGQHGLFAKKLIPRLTIFPVSCPVYKEEDFYTTRAGLFQMELSERYAYEFRTKPKRGLEGICFEDHETIVADLWSGNEVKYVNDYRNSFFAANVEFCEMLIYGQPHLILVTLCDIEPDQELLTDYGSSYWENRSLKDELLWEVKSRILRLFQLLHKNPSS